MTGAEIVECVQHVAIGSTIASIFWSFAWILVTLIREEYKK